MAQTHFALSWDSYQSTICSHFSTLQQNGEFVDLTLAADGHLVRVHQLILGIASPYIKELIRSAPCKHPVIFLNNVSYTTLSCILQYVYTGEVAIAEEELTTFFEAAKALQIQGIDIADMNTETVKFKNEYQKPALQMVQVHFQDEKASHFERVSVPMAAKNVKLTGNVITTDGLINSTTSGIHIITRPKNHLEGSMKQSDDLEMDVVDETGEDSPVESGGDDEGDGDGATDPIEYIELSPIVDDSSAAYPNTKELQYTVSNRGSLQLILNRYVYNLFSKSNGGVVRRWRCVDYRNQKCPACTVTNGNVVIKRTNLHNHPYHDKKILGKIKKKAVYSAIKLAVEQTNAKS